MSKHDDLERMAHAYHWWTKDEAAAMLHGLLDQLQEAPATAKLTLRMGKTAEGVDNPWLCVEGGETYEGFDASRPCPPFCT